MDAGRPAPMKKDLDGRRVGVDGNGDGKRGTDIGAYEAKAKGHRGTKGGKNGGKGHPHSAHHGGNGHHGHGHAAHHGGKGNHGGRNPHGGSYYVANHRLTRHT